MTLVLVPGLNVFSRCFGVLILLQTIRYGIGCATALIATPAPWQPVLSRALPQTGGYVFECASARPVDADTGSVRRYPRCWHP